MLKPGQHTLKREYYGAVNHEKPDGAAVLNNYSRFQSNYDHTQNLNVKLGEYKVPAKSMNTMVSYELVHNPSLFNSSKIGRDLSKTQTSFGRSNSSKPGALSLTSHGPRVNTSIAPTAHWQSTYRKTSNQVASGGWNPSKRPMWSINREAYSSSRCTYTTEFSETIGTYGHKPRSILGFDSVKQ